MARDIAGMGNEQRTPGRILVVHGLQEGQPVGIEIVTEWAQVLLEGVGKFPLQAGIGVQDIVSGSFMAKGGPGDQTFARVGGRKVNDGGLAAKDRRGIDRPGVRAKVRVAPLHERGNGAEIRRLHALAVFGAEEAVIQIAHHFFKGVGRGFREAFPLLKNSLRDVHHEAAECLPRWNNESQERGEVKRVA